MPIRLVVCIDFNVETLAEAYAAAHRHLGELAEKTPEIEGWESTDEAFDANGEPVDVTELQSVRMAFFEQCG